MKLTILLHISPEVKNEWSHTFTPFQAFMVCIGTTLPFTFKIKKYFLLRLQLALSFLKGHYLVSLSVCNGRLLVVPSHVCLFLSDAPVTGSCILPFYLLLRRDSTLRHLHIALLSVHKLTNLEFSFLGIFTRCAILY